MPKPPEKPGEPVVLSVDLIDSGKLYRAGEPTPFTEASLPAHLKQYIATGQEDFFHPRERDFYNNPRPDCGVVYQPTGSDSQWTRRQARQVASVAQEQLYAEQEAEAAGQLPKETQEALEDAHSKHSALMKAQMAYNQRATDIAYEQAAAEAAAKESQFYVRRGGAWGKVQNCRLRPGETVFVKRENGQMEAAGCVDSTGSPPPSEVIP